MPYSVVVFDSDNSVDTAPTSWVSIEDEVVKKVGKPGSYVPYGLDYDKLLDCVYI